MSCISTFIHNGSITSRPGASNCGIGKGGFQPGNKCAMGKGKPKAVPPKTKGSQGVVGSGHVNDSLKEHKGPDGQLSPARKEIHQRIIDSHFEGKTPVSNPIALIMGGGPAAGKSTILSDNLWDKESRSMKPNVNQKVRADSNSVMVNADEIKAMLPEWGPGLERGDAGIAAYLHEESSFIAKQIQDRASRGSYNSVLDGTGNSDFESLSGKLNKMRNAGQKVIGHYVTVSTEEALRRNQARALETKRMVPEATVRSTHKGVSQILGQAIKAGLFDEVTLWDTEGNGSPVKVVEATGSNLNVIDKALWRKFQLKATE